ncbi:MAG: hypothetical protein WCP93_00665 [Candidatus Berkelbacteria bacterium]
MPAPSWDLAISVIFLVGIAFGWILQKDKIIGTLLGVYVGLIMTQAFSGNIQKFFQGDTTLFNQIWIRADASPFTVNVIIFALCIMIVSTRANVSSSKSKGLLSPLEIVVYSVLTTGLILGSLAYFMPADARTPFIMTSRMAKFIIENYTFWLAAPVVFMVVSGFINKDKND